MEQTDRVANATEIRKVRNAMVNPRIERIIFMTELKGFTAAYDSIKRVRKETVLN
jgi:hypothetical protein